MFAARLVFSRGLSSLRKVPLQHRNGKNVKHLQGKMVPLLLCLLLLNGLNLADSISLDPDGGYKDIVIRINKDVPEDQCPQIITGLKALLRDSSQFLHGAAGVWFKSATIVIPSDWRDSKCQAIIRPPKVGISTLHKSDFIVADLHAIYGKQPFTQQSASACGQAGDFLRIPYHYLTAWNANHSRLFIKEWAKFRYGIFDELGFPADLQYPNSFKWNGQILPTITTDVPLNGEWINAKSQSCDPHSEENCKYVLVGDNDQVSCSLAALHYLPNVTRFCSKHEIASFGPTKHNVLCQGKSSNEVIQSHADFANNQARHVSDLSQIINPQVNVVRQPETQYVLIMETSSVMDNDKQWKWINKAAQKFIRYDLPVNSNLAIVTFSDVAKIEHGMVQVHSDQVRARLADTIPDKYHLSKSSRRCVACAVKKVIEDVISDQKVGAHLILLTQGGPETLSADDENLLRENVIKYNIKLNAIVMPGTSSHYLPFYDEITSINDGKTHIVHYQSNPLDFFVSINRAFADILHMDSIYPTERPELVHLKTLQTVGTLSSGTFLIDSTLGRDTIFGIYVEDEEDHLIKAIQFTDSRGKKYGPFLRMSSDYDLINFKTINYPPGKAPPFSAPNQIGMTWKYTIEWHNLPNHGNANPKSIVMVTSKSRSQSESHLISVKSWLDDTTLYVQVLRGDKAIVDAQVSAVVTIELATNGSQIKLPSVQLVDNGFGDPDIMSGDGIYSRYLGKYSHACGRYKFDIEVNDNENNAFYIVKQQHISQQQSCCGSAVQVATEDTKKIGTFRRFVSGPVLYFCNKSSSDLDTVNPGKIGDLKIKHLVGSSDRLLAEWTAPGGDADQGSVASYRFIFSSNIQDLLDPKEGHEPEVLLGFDRIEEAGTRAKFDFNFPHYNKDFYVGAYAFDLTGNRGKISNLVHVKLVAPNEPTVPSDSNHLMRSDYDWVIIGSICGVITVLFVMAVSCISYYIYVSRSKARSCQTSKDSTGSGSTSSVMMGTTTSTGSGDETSSFDSDIKTNYGKQSSVTPVYWSASQLLSKMDNVGPQSLQSPRHFYHQDYNQQPVSLEQPAPLWTYRVRDIPEEYTVTVSETVVMNKPRNITQV